MCVRFTLYFSLIINSFCLLFRFGNSTAKSKKWNENMFRVPRERDTFHRTNINIDLYRVLLLTCKSHHIAHSVNVRALTKPLYVILWNCFVLSFLSLQFILWVCFCLSRTANGAHTSQLITVWKSVCFFMTTGNGVQIDNHMFMHNERQSKRKKNFLWHWPTSCDDGVVEADELCGTQTTQQIDCSIWRETLI